jgi:surface antigen
MNKPATRRLHTGGAILALACLLFTATAMSAGLGWLRGGPASFFTDRDWDLVRETLDATLDQAADGEAREWSNDQSGAGGKMTVLLTETHAEVTCRKLRIEGHARGASSDDDYTFCRRGDGAWGIGAPK